MAEPPGHGPRGTDARGVLRKLAAGALLCGLAGAAVAVGRGAGGARRAGLAQQQWG